MENSNTTLKVIAGFLGGALVGSALGILFAPDKGSETRSKIADGASDMASDLKNKVKHQADVLLGRVEDLEKQAKEKLQNK